MVKRSVKYSLGLLGLLAIVLVVTPFFLDVNNYKSQISKAVEKATGRTLQIGNIEASLFPWVGVRLTDLHLANRAGFSARDFLSVESVDIQVALLPLLSKEIEIKEFKLDGPELFLERNAEGAGNWEDLASPDTNAAEVVAMDGKSKPATEVKSSPLAALNAEALHLNHGRFIWVDSSKGGRIELSDMKVEVNDVQADRPIEVTASARVGSDEIRLSAQVGPLGDVSKLDPEKLPLQLNLTSEEVSLSSFKAWIPELPEFFGKRDDARLRFNVQLEQRPNGVRLSVGDASLLAKVTVNSGWKVEMTDASRIKLNEFHTGLNGHSLINAQGEIRLGTEMRYQLRIKGEPVKRTWLASLIPDLESMYAAHPSPWQELKLGAFIAGDADRLELRDVQLMLDQEVLQASGVASFGKAPDIRLRLTSRELHLNPWLPQPQKKRAGAPSVETELAKASVSPKSNEPDLRAFKDWRISSQMQIEKLYMSGLELGNLRGTLNGSRGLFKLDPLSFDLSGGQVTETATLDVSRYPARWTESVHMSGVNLGPVLKALADMDMLDGTLQMDTDLKATGLLPDNAMRNLNGSGKVLLRDGSVKGFDIAGTMRNLTALGQGGGQKKTDFAQLSGAFTIKNGVVKNDDLFMASPLFRLTGNGTVNLPQGSLDYHVKPRLVGTLTGQGDTVTVRKGLSVPLRIRGPFASPRITPEVDPATLIENIGAIRGGGIGNILKGATGQKKDTQSAPQDQQKPTPEKQIQKAIEGLIPGF